jgi:hypothetical protein
MGAFVYMLRCSDLCMAPASPLIPAQAGIQFFLVRNLVAQITPSSVLLLNELELPRTIPFLDLALADKSGLARVLAQTSILIE